MKVRAIFLDIDGTLVGSNGRIGSRTREQIQRLRTEGIPICLATGRASFGAASVVKELGISDPSMFFSGALIKHPQRGETLFEEPLPPAMLPQLLAAMRAHNLYVEACSRDCYFIEEDSWHSEEHAKLLGVPGVVRSLDEVIAREQVLKLVVGVRDQQEEQLLACAMEPFSELPWAVARGSLPGKIHYANITSPRATRERAFAELISILGVPAEGVIACGDSPSDVPFLKLAGVGVALMNAPASVKEAAKLIVPSVDEDGVGQFLAHVRGGVLMARDFGLR